MDDGVVENGVILGVALTGEVESGSEFGLTIGIDEVGLVGVIVGTVVIGVVMSLLVVEIGVFVNCSLLFSWSCSFIFPTFFSFFVTFKPEQRK